MTTFMFPGQGSQKKGMGKELFDQYPELTAQADDILGYSLRELCLENPDGRLTQTQYTQPALFVVSVLTYLARLEETGVKSDFVAGHSLGEYSALFAAGAFNFETGLLLVKRRGELMRDAGPGAMAAVVALDEDIIQRVLRDNGLDGIDVANFNSPEQIVISGPKEEIARAQPFFEEAGARMYSHLKVSSAFHSRYMQDARDTFATFLDAFSFNDLEIPTISNVAARPHRGDKIKELLADQITHSVRWTETIRYLMGRGEEEFTEVGPGKVLMGLYRKIRKLAKPLVLDQAPAPSTPNTPPPSAQIDTLAASLGSTSFKQDYNLKYAYVAGSLFAGITSREMVVRMGRAGLMTYLGTGNQGPEEIAAAVRDVRGQLPEGLPFGASLVSNLTEPHLEDAAVDVFLEHEVRNVEVISFLQLSPALVRYRLKGLRPGKDGHVEAPNRVMGRVTRPEVATVFMSPAPERIIAKLEAEGRITHEEATLGRKIPMVDDLCVEADSGGNTDQGSAYALMPAMIVLRDEMMKQYGYPKRIRVGAAGGIGTPEAAAAAFILGAEFVVTGSINLCTVEAGTSNKVKDMLAAIDVQDTAYSPSGDMFEIGAKMQVLKKGVFFPARANKLYNLYQHFNSLMEIDEKSRKQIQEKYFKKSFDEVWQEIRAEYLATRPEEIQKAERNPRHKMALVFKWYFRLTHRLASEGDPSRKVDFQVHCGPALGAFNQWVKGTELEDWRNRHPDIIAEKLMTATAALLKQRLETVFGSNTN